MSMQVLPRLLRESLRGVLVVNGGVDTEFSLE